MNTGIFQATTVPLLEQAVKFGQARHNVLAGNIANVDTPGYRARDLSVALFQQRLAEATEARNAPLSQESNYCLSDPIAGNEPAVQMEDAFETILRHDDGKVSLEQQVAELTKNQMQFNTAIAVMSQQFRLLEAAISERA